MNLKMTARESHLKKQFLGIVKVLLSVQCAYHIYFILSINVV